ncbi:hypothetical protein Patl1_12390 [Pistacia atlantica]|uniref:Uncharacterized protein n=1 Tax=Pistacia atlantica TaxID=434234 RepID=A0ACC1A5K5_9ROSI|nr:hypothetical protein Patl1_12390 [Pistacia atlantica]
MLYFNPEIAEIDFAHSSNWPMDHQLYPDSEENITSSLPGIFCITSVGMPSCAHSDKENDHQTQLSDSEYEYFSESENDHQTQLSDSEYEYEYLSESENDHQTQFSDSEYEYFSELETDSNLTIEEHISVGSQTDGGLSQELGDVTESANGIDDSSIPAQKVFIMERFLKNQPEIIADTVLPCRVPPSESLHMRFGKLSLNSVATPNYNPGKIEPAQAETVLNWHSQNASARSSLQLRSLLDELRQKIQDLHQEILSLISLRQDFSRQEKEIKHLKIQLKSLERTLTERTFSDNTPWYKQTSGPDDLPRGASASLFTSRRICQEIETTTNPPLETKNSEFSTPVMKPTPIPDLYPPAQHMMEPSTNPITEYLRYYAYTETTPLQNLPIIYPTIGISSSEPTTDVSDSDSSSDSDHPLIFMHQRSTSAAPVRSLIREDDDWGKKLEVKEKLHTWVLHKKLASAIEHKEIVNHLVESDLTSHLSSLNLDDKDGDA